MSDEKNEAEPSGASGGSVAGDPFVWAVLDSRGTVVAYTCRETAEAYCNGTFNQMIPLYRQPHPTLIDEEREAVDTAEASLMRESTDLNTPLPVRQRLGAAAATLRGLLERTANRDTTPPRNGTPSGTVGERCHTHLGMTG